MSTPTTDVVEQAIANLDAEDAGLKPEEGKENQDGKKTEDAGAGKPATGDDAGKAGDEDAGKAGDDKGKEGEDEGEFTADDALEVEEKPTDAKPAAPTDNAGIQMSPAEQKYIVDNIGQPIVINGYKLNAEGEREPYEIKAYAWENVPKDFVFASDSDQGAAADAFRRLDQKATDLLGNYRQQQSNQQAQDFERRENEGIRADVADLQKEGRFPKFKVQPGAAGFDDTAEAKQMADVLKIMGERNEVYLQQFNQGRPYKHIGFAEAYEIYERTNPDKKAEQKRDEAQAKEDQERKGTAERGSDNRGASASNIMKPTVKPGTTMRDIMARIDAEE